MFNSDYYSNWQNQNQCNCNNQFHSIIYIKKRSAQMTSKFIMFFTLIPNLLTTMILRKNGYTHELVVIQFLCF